MRFNNFKINEFRCPCCGMNKIQYSFVTKLDKARDISGIPYTINSGYACPEHNLARGGVPNSSHVLGLGCDISCVTNIARMKIVQGLIMIGFTRIGIYPNHIHVDADESKPTPRMWLEAL